MTQHKSARSDSEFVLLRLASLAIIFLLYRAGEELLGISSGSGVLLGGYSRKWLAGLAAYFLAATVGGALCVWAFLLPANLFDRLDTSFIPWGASLRRWRLVLAGALLLLPSVILLGEWGKHLTTPAFRMVLLAGASMMVGLLLSDRTGQVLSRAALALLLSASLFAVAKRLVLVTDFPFKLYWSEGNRLWDYSLYFVHKQYEFSGEFTFPSYLTPGRHGLWGLPFILPGIGIAGVRLWDVILWTVPYFTLGWLLFAPTRIELGTTERIGFSLWTLLFMTQGGIFAPLIISMMLLAWKANPRFVGWVAALAAIASFYAGMSRWTWFAAPAMIAGLWILLDNRAQPDRKQRLIRGLLVGVAGLAGGLASLIVMSLAFPQPDPVFSTSLSQPLLWYRLLPNPTNDQGILLGTVLAAGPLIALLAWGGSKRRTSWGWLERTGLGLSLAAFLAVGLAASVKIGGGSNIHNLDMFLVGLLFAVAWGVIDYQRRRTLSWSSFPTTIRGLVILAIVIPSLDVMRSGGPPQLPGEAAVSKSMSTIRAAIGRAASVGEVLFIDQRQLLTFGQIGGVTLVAEYELKDMMNQAMSANRSYFDQLSADLANHRFELIVSDPLPSFVQGSEYEFGEENDAWLEFAARPLNRYYKPIEKLEVGIWLLAPARDQ